jgi:hypothetical protein
VVVVWGVVVGVGGVVEVEVEVMKGFVIGVFFFGLVMFVLV